MTHIGYVLFLCLILALSEAEPHHRAAGATAPGDLIIGGLFAIHDGVEKAPGLSQPQQPICVEFNTVGLTEALAMIQAVETVNRSPMLSDLGITLGYHIHDSCSDITTALRASADFMHMDCGTGTNTSNCAPSTMAVIGASYSEMSITVARQLNLKLIPQISYASTATILSDKVRFPAFMRTVPSDKYQTSAMVKLLSDSGWNWVGVVITDGDYGRSALDSFVSQASEAGICVAFKEILPDSLTNPAVLDAVHHTVQTICDNPKAKVVVSFARPRHMKHLFNTLHRNVTNDRVWIASDGWSTSGDVLDAQDLAGIGKVVGFTFKSGDVAPFHHYLRSLEVGSGVKRNNSFLREFYYRVSTAAATDTLINNTFADAIFSIQMAVSAIAHAVADLCHQRDCKTPGAVQPWELLAALKNTTFEKEGETYTFDQNGDINLGYDVSLWKTSKGIVYTHDVVAEYHPMNNSFTYKSKPAREHLSYLQNVVSKCSASCVPGEFKKTAEGQHTCCYECINCTENHYSNDTDMDQCLSCDHEREWAVVGSSECKPKTLEHFCWRDGFAVVLLTLAALGILLALLVGLLFLWHRHTPVVKAAGGPLSHLVLISLTGSFVSAAFFVGRPTGLQCKARQVLFGLSFTLCVSCILVKSLKILLAFQLNPQLQRLLHRLYRPYAIVCACVGLQALTCTLWLVLRSPSDQVSVFPTTILAECDEGSYVAFGVMLGYIAVLALVCFAFAFKGRKLPENYNEAKFITFGMLIYLISWVIFIPVYVTTSGKYLPAVEMVVILISNYGILSCHFLPKCYVILFKKESNTKDAFLQNVYEYSQRSKGSIGHSKNSLAEEKSDSQVYSIFKLPHFISHTAQSTAQNSKAMDQNHRTGAPTQDQLSSSPSVRRTFSV